MTELPGTQPCCRDDDVLARVQSWVLGHGDADSRSLFEKHLQICDLCREEAGKIAILLARLAPVDERSDEEREDRSESNRHDLLWSRIEDRLGLEGAKDCIEEDSSVGSSDRASIQSWRDWDPDSASEARVVPAKPEDFEPTGVEGISVRKLHVSKDRSEITMLVRMEEGAAFPAHTHGGLERCLVLSGELHVGDQLARAGDYVMAEEGSVHPVQWTETGCELFITSSTSDELIDS